MPHLLPVHNRLTSAAEELASNKEKLVMQNNKLSDYEQQIQLLRKQIQGLENEKEKDKRKIAELQEALNRAREVETAVFVSLLSSLMWSIALAVSTSL